MPDIVDTAQHPEEPSTLIVSFGERYQAEAVRIPFPPLRFLCPKVHLCLKKTLTRTQFIDASLPLSKADPAIGPLEMEWVANDALGGIPSETSNKDTGTGSAATGGGGEGDEEMGDAAKAEHDGEADADSVRVKDEDGDLDVAEDEDRWL